MLETRFVRPGLQVAPLSIEKSLTPGDDAYSEQYESTSTNSYLNAGMTPPLTPDGSQEDLTVQHFAPDPVFHNFLRAFYPFQPACTITDSTITLPLDEGDVVLVHSIHPNGWADGTLLVSGDRGWLPTNYCEAYDPEEMRNLLQALLNFWDLLRSTATNDQEIFGNQEFMKGLIAGVRYLLEHTHCLTRESATIQRNESLRRGRKSLLSELQSLVKTSKRLQEILKGILQSDEDVNDIVDEMILKAFKIVVKGVRFLDILEEDRRLRAPTAVTVMATVIEEAYVPPTPPAESSEFGHGQANSQDAGSRSVQDGDAFGGFHQQTAESVQTDAVANRRLSSVYSRNEARMSPANLMRGSPRSTSISHRVSLVGPSAMSHPENLVSARLNTSHDIFLSYLGSFIGRLHLQSQSRSELALAIKQSAKSGGELLAVVDTVCRFDTLGSESLQQSRAAMYDRIRDLVYSAREILNNVGPDAEDVIMPQDNSILLLGATGCVKAAGECVAKTKWVIERIGDFEFETDDGGLGIDLGGLEHATATEDRPKSSPEPSNTVTNASELPSASAHVAHLSLEKPLPQVPDAIDVDEFTPNDSSQSAQSTQPSSSRPHSMVDVVPSNMALSAPSPSSALLPLPTPTTALHPEESYSPATDTSHDSEYQSSFHSEATIASSFGTNNTYLSRHSESSTVSQSSTRATTPELGSTPKNQPSLSELSATASSSMDEEVDDVEDRLLEKTFAHELMFNKEGQVTGGSLPALVERLTTHESTPDAVFVSAFYLTFRLFCSPEQFAQALIDRFDYVGEVQHMANPVRLRVYNVMKGWLESHWRESTDHNALPIIRNFAAVKLSAVLPSAGKRLLELANKVSSTDGSLVPRLVSSMGKTSTSISQYIPADAPLPNSILSRNQLSLLNNWKTGSATPSILDFDPLEIARQLTLKQMTIFCSIQPEELLGSQWMKKGGVNSPNVKAMSGLSTDVSNLVADSILQCPEAKKRAAIVKQWIKIAQQCLELNNYDGLMAIICSLNSSIISRLRKTWDLVSGKRLELFKTLQAVVEPSNNNKVLRARLQDHVPPCLPFLGMFLTDLTFVDIGNPATKQLPGAGSNERGLTVVNFDKHARTAKIIGELQRFQIPYRLKEVPLLQEWFQAQVTHVKDSDSGNVQVKYYRRSVLLEPRENTARTPVDGSATTGQKTDLFGWMSKDRGHNNATLTA